MKNKFKLQFNQDAPGRYWYLRWIGRVTYDKGYKIELHFINASKNDDYFSSFIKEYKQVQIVVAEALHFFTIGAIYDSVDHNLKRPKQYVKSNQIVSVKRKPYYNTSDRELNILDLEYSPIDRDIEYSGFKYYWFEGRTNFIDDVKVFMPVHVFCHYFYFSRSNLITIIFNHTLNEIFSLNDKQIISTLEGRIGHVKYDNTKIDRGQARALAPFLFIKNNAGIKYIDAIGNNLVSFFYNNSNNRDILNQGSYLKTEIPFQDEIHFKVQGKHFHDGNGNNYLLAYRIVNHNFIVDSPLTVDEIRLEEIFPNEKKKKNGQEPVRSGVRVIPPNPNDNTEITLDNQPGNSRLPIQENLSETGGLFDLDIPINHIIHDTEDKDYDPNVILTDLELSKATLNAYETDSDSEYIRQKYTASISRIDRFDFMSLSIKCLKEKYDVQYSFDPLDLKQSTNEIYGIYENGNFHKVMVVELCYEGQYFYVIDFEKGYAGFLHHSNNEQIIPFKLENFVTQSLRVLTELNKHEHIWTIIKKKIETFRNMHDMVLDISLSHQVKDFKTDLEAAEHMADKIYDDRILKLVS